MPRGTVMHVCIKDVRLVPACHMAERNMPLDRPSYEISIEPRPVNCI